MRVILTLILFQQIILRIARSEATSSLVLHPIPVSTLNLKELYGAVTIYFSTEPDGSYAYVGGGKAGTFIISLENTQVQKVITQIPGYLVQKVVRNGNYLFVSDKYEGVSIYDISDIKNYKFIVNLKKYVAQTQYCLVSKSGKYLFILSNGFVIAFDLTDIAAPKYLGNVGVPAQFSYRMRFNYNESYIIVSNHLSGIQIIDIRNLPNLVLRASQNPSFVSWDGIFTIDMKVIYALDAYAGLFVANIQDMPNIPATEATLFTLTFKPIYQMTDALMMSLHLTQSNSHLLIGFRSIGIYLFTVNKDNYEEITFVQHLQGSYMTTSIEMPENNEDLLLASNGNEFFIFQAVSPILNQEFPNFFNTFQSNLTPKTLPYTVPCVYCMKDGKHIISLNLEDNQFTIYNIENPYQPKEVVNVPRPSTIMSHPSQVEVSEDLKYLYISQQVSGVNVYDISTITNPQLILENFPPLLVYGNQVLTMRVNSGNSIGVISNSFYGVYVVNTSDPANIVRLAKYTVPSSCGFQECLLLKDSVRIICSCREVGVFFFQYKDTEIKLVSVYMEIGSESSVLSSDEKILYACLGFQGVYIINIEDFTNPKYLSSIILKGWVQFLSVLFNEKYIVASQVEKGQLSIINIEDRSNPYIQQILEFQNESSQYVCTPPAGNVAFFIGNAGLRQIQIITDLKIHTQIQVEQLDSDGNFLYYNTLTEGDYLLVGQVVQMTFVPLFTEKQIKISNVKYYRYFEKQVLPSWMTFLPDKKQILMTVDKSGGKNDFSTEKKGENILVLEILIEVRAVDLQLTGVIDSALSVHLIDVLKREGYLDYYAQLTDKLDSKKSFYLDFFDTDFPKSAYTNAEISAIQMQIKNVLVFSKYDYPIRFFVKSSLNFQYSSSSSRLLNISSRGLASSSTSVVETPSAQITVFMQIIQNGKFVKKTLEGVLAAYSDDLTSLRISGQTTYVDSILKKNIQVSNSTNSLSDVTMKILISDSNNYDLTIETNLTALQFATVHQPVKFDAEKSLQTQLSKIYSAGDIPVETRFQFSFDMSTFTQPDNLPISYSAFILNEDGTQTEISTGLWIEFNSQTLGFSGSKTIGYFRTYETIKIVASDSYSSTSSSFEIRFWTIPFLYFIQLGVQIIGPLLGVLGIWKYRHEIHLCIIERNNRYSDETAILGETYRKQIILFSQVYSNGKKLWEAFLKKNPNFMDGEFLKNYVQDKNINIPQIMQRLEKVYLPIQHEFPAIDPREFDFDDSRLVRVVKHILFFSLLQKDKNTYEALQSLKQYAKQQQTNHKDWYKYYIKIELKTEIVNKKVILKSQLEFEKKELEKTKKIERILEESQRFSMQISDRNTTSIFKSQSPNYFKKSNLYIEDYLTPIQEDNLSSNSNRIPGSNANNEEELFCDLNPFPEIQVLKETVTKALKSIDFFQYYDENLLTELIILEASGLPCSAPLSFNPAFGESIHVSSDSLLTLQAFKRKKSGFLSKIFQMINLEYSPIGLERNNPLPKWLNYQIVDGIINLWGVPSLSDEKEILIRIINRTLLTVHSFKILIQDRDRNDFRDRNILRKVTKRIGQSDTNRNYSKNILQNSTKLSQRSIRNNTDSHLLTDYNFKEMIQKRSQENEDVHF